ncbi:YgfZ/GcvT domain-containing protein [Sinimarinibacterium thermocellulolyticum]|uniref:Folate-binding protein n=1 Tax=Sinimarinibacterium thermocellulolyticum TaxID=3170016 RepID=A0ABV2A8K0_9GAMM
MKDCIPAQLDELVYATVRGADGTSFLQGQLSSDLRLLDDMRAQISSYNSAKGRMLAVLHLMRRDDAIVLELHRDIAAPTCKRLRMFVLRAKVTIEEDGGLCAFGLIGADAAARLAALGLPVPDAPLDCTHDAPRGITIVRRLGALARYSIHGTSEALAPLLAAVGPLQDYTHWRRADIEAGVPTVYPATADHFIPQTANLDRLGGIGFDKGCYTGQEIIARVHYLGQVKRRLFVARMQGSPPAPGSEVRSADGASVGEIVDAVVDAEGAGSLASLVLQLGHANDALRLADGRTVHLVGPAAPPDAV